MAAWNSIGSASRTRIRPRPGIRRGTRVAFARPDQHLGLAFVGEVQGDAHADRRCVREVEHSRRALGGHDQVDAEAFAVGRDLEER